MIIQKLVSAIRRQDWFQVLVEVLIVIVGIFLGLQVQTWYEALEDRRQEAFYLALLHDEVEQIETKFKNYFPNINGRVEVLASLREQYNQNEQFVEISNIQCNAIIVSHIHTNFISTVTTIDELESTGRSQIIENPSIRRLMAVLKSNQNFSNTFIAGLRGDAVNLAAKFPEFIDVNTFTTISSGYELDAAVGNHCKIPTPDKTIDYKNSLVANAARYSTYNSVITNQFKSLVDLHHALDKELAIIHKELSP